MNEQKHAEMKQRMANLFYRCPKHDEIFHRVSDDVLRHKALREFLKEKNLLVEDKCPKCRDWDIAKEIIERG